MERWLRTEEWRYLTSAEKAARCSRMAEEARALAAGADPKLRASFLEISVGWLELAAEINRHGDRVSSIRDSV